VLPRVMERPISWPFSLYRVLDSARAEFTLPNNNAPRTTRNAAVPKVLGMWGMLANVATFCHGRGEACQGPPTGSRARRDNWKAKAEPTRQEV
jgi:hypothetical protein